jgi:hypothetical protein
MPTLTSYPAPSHKLKIRVWGWSGSPQNVNTLLCPAGLKHNESEVSSTGSKYTEQGFLPKAISRDSWRSLSARVKPTEGSENATPLNTVISLSNLWA